MRAYRFRIALLTLGVVFGYGSALAHWTHGHSYRHGYGYGDCSEEDYDHHHRGRDFGSRDDYDHERPARSAPAEKPGT